MSPPPKHELSLLFLEKKKLQEMVGGSDKDKLKDSPGLGIFGGLSTTRPVIYNSHPHLKSEHYQSFVSHLSYTHYPMTVTNARPRICHFLHN